MDGACALSRLGMEYYRSYMKLSPYQGLLAARLLLFILDQGVLRVGSNMKSFD